MKDKISVIVPVYNVEQFIKKCIDSIRLQSYSNLEIILVDDGSTDASSQICDEYAQIDERICVLHRKNEGPSSARNAGLDAATGEYIAFIDSDDYIAENYFEVLLQVLKETSVEMSLVRYQSVDEENNYRMNVETFLDDGTVSVHSGTEVINTRYRKDTLIYVVVWGKLFKRDVWRQLRYPEGCFHEDERVERDLYSRINNFASVDKKLYFYRVREGSIMDKMTEKRYNDMLEWIRIEINYYKESGNAYMEHEAKRYFCRMYVKYYFHVELRNKLEFRSYVIDVLKSKQVTRREYYKYLCCYFSVPLYYKLLRRKH